MTSLAEVAHAPRTIPIGKAPNTAAMRSIIQGEDRVLMVRDGYDLTVTPELASAILASHQHRKQRRFRQFHINALADEIVAGNFIKGTQIHFAQYPKGRLELLDNHHRLMAIIESGVPVTFRVLITNVQTESQSDELYRRIDRMQLPRKTSDVIEAEGIVEGQGVQKEIARATFEAVRFIHTGFAKKRGAAAHVIRSDDRRLAACDEFWPVARIYQDAIAGAIRGLKSPMKAPCVVAIALATLRYQPRLAEQFWSNVAKDEGPSPCGTLFRYLLLRANNNPIDTMRACAAAWNAFVSGRDLVVIRRNDKPVTLAGTPWERAPAE